MILVVGATGNTGREVVQQLRDKGVFVRALVRSLQKATTIQMSGVEFVYGDLSKPETLDAALEGVDKVFLVTSPDLRQAELQGNFIKAAKSAGVRHIVRVSSIGSVPGVQSAVLRMHWETDQQLEASGIPYTHLRPNYFMQNFLYGSAATIKAEGVLYAPMKDAKIALVDVRDIAAVAVTALTQAGHEGKAYNITGPESLSLAEVAEKFSVATGKPVTYVNISLETFRQALLAKGRSEWMANSDVEIMKLFENHDVAAEVTNVVAEVTCKEPITFDQFVQDYIAAFRIEFPEPNKYSQIV